MMRDRMMWRGPFPDADPAPLPEAVAAVRSSLRLAWEADRTGLILLFAVDLATTAAEVAQLVASGRAVDAVVEGRRPASQTRRLALLGGLGLGAVAGRSVSGAISSRVSQTAQRLTEGRILDVAAALELGEVEDPAFQDRLQRAFIGAQRQSMLFANASALPQAAVGLVGAAAAMTASDRALAPLAVVGAVPRWFVMRKAQDPMAAMRARSRDSREVATIRFFLTGPAAAHELRVFGAAPFLRERHDQLALEGAEAQRAISKKNARRNLMGSVAARLAEAPAAARLALRVTRKEASVADAVSGGLATRKVGGGIHRMVDTVGAMRRNAALAGDTADFLGRMPPVRTGPAPPAGFSRIVVDDVHFTYPGAPRPVLEGVDMEVRQGEVVALVGENGCGKTTLAKILCALYRPTKGTIRWDGTDVGGCDPAAVRAQVAVVFQNFVLYPPLTAAENIGIGMPARMGDRDAIVTAARRAGAHDAIAALPKGYDTVLSRQFGGVDLSMGQGQRVALARAFLRDAPLVVLDEPTAALDPRAERDLFETVASLYRSRSAVLISHRLSSVRFADRICVLAGGRIIESGTHDELVGAAGAYAELFELQARSYR